MFMVDRLIELSIGCDLEISEILSTRIASVGRIYLQIDTNLSCYVWEVMKMYIKWR